MNLFDTPLSTARLVLLAVALLIACGFEFVNGFHDTANAVATVIYTHSLRPRVAVMLSGLCNFLGVYLGGIAVAMSIIKLLPVELLVHSGAGAGLAMVLALLIAAILWNLGTWYFGLPASSSHTLIGGILGVGIANSLMPGHTFGDGVNWHKVAETGEALIFSPMVGLLFAAGLLLLAKKLIPSKELYKPADPNKKPPTWVRGLLTLTCSGVSFAHGSNDGQKGVGLIMLILVGLLPADFALNTAYDKAHIDTTVAITQRIDETTVAAYGSGSERVASNGDMAVLSPEATKVLEASAQIRSALAGKSSMREVPPEARFAVRTSIMEIDGTLGALEKAGKGTLTPEQAKQLKKDRAELRGAIDYAPSWVLVLVALSLGLGTMIGWKRIVVTVGEKIGKTHLSYAQGASAEIVAMTTIGLSAGLGLPVSTTHVLSSGIAGTMVAQKSGLQRSTIRNIALAWVLTLPAAMLLGGALFLLFRAVIPDAHASTTPAVHFVDQGSETATVTPASAGHALRLHGSSTVGAELAPALAEGYLRGAGATEVSRRVDEAAHAVFVTGTMPGASEPTAFEIETAGTGTGFDDLAQGKCDLVMASRAVNDDEARRLREGGHGDLRGADSENVLGLDGIAVIVSGQNPATTVSLQDLAKMYTGEIAAWHNGSAADGPIALFARDESSGTYEAFREAVLGDRAMASWTKRVPASRDLADAVSVDAHALGFVGMTSVHTAKTLSLSDNGSPPLFPTPFTVATEDYPLTRRLYLYAPTPRTHPLTQAFVQFALSPAGQAIVARSGFVEMTARAQASACTGTCPPKYVEATAGAKRLSFNFRFAKGGTAIDSRASQDLPRLVGYLASHKGERAVLLGFADSSGAADANLAVSSARAQAVAQALAAYGVKPESVLAFGEEMPVASNATALGRERNRRVEVWVK